MVRPQLPRCDKVMLADDRMSLRSLRICVLWPGGTLF